MIFEEKQRFTQWWLYALLGAIAIPLFYHLSQIDTFDFDNSEFVTLLFSISIFILVGLLMLWMSLRTNIDSSGIHYHFYPFKLSPATLSWSEIKHIEVREYSPISEYGGWGIRYSSNGKALNVKGNKGIQIIKQDGSKLLIGTQMPKKATAIIDKYKVG